MDSLFAQPQKKPLADRMRPTRLSDFVGQETAVGERSPLRRMIEKDQLQSVLFYGPPGTGKTTLAQVIAHMTGDEFVAINAVSSGVPELRKLIAKAQELQRGGMGRTIVFIDEIHRFNKAQQDAFLPFVEKGSIILIGATTENPSFEVNGALLSRCRVFVLQSLDTKDIVKLLKRALEDDRGFGRLNAEVSDDILDVIANFANGDARSALSVLEMAVLNGDAGEDCIKVTRETIEQCTSKKSLLYDKKGEEHYNLISALHKSMRNSDPDAAVYWLARMLEAGEDPLYIARRIIRFASEDIGLATPAAMQQAVAAYQACHFIGMPECTDNLTQAVVYMSLSPKSNALDKAYNEAKRDALSQIAEPVPLVIRNAPTKLMKDLDYGRGYQYAHDTEDKLTDMQCLPDSLVGREYYRPTEQGNEKNFKTRLEQIKTWKKQRAEEKK